MGHVDHGKTSLLDRLRSTNTVAFESGGITQRLAAFKLDVQLREHSGDQMPTSVTFLDTPGHEAFTSMRESGARVTDVALLVISIEDGVKEQTREVIRLIQESKLACLVGVTKVLQSSILY